MLSKEKICMIDAHIHPYLNSSECLNILQIEGTEKFFKRLKNYGIQKAIGSVLYKQIAFKCFDEVVELNSSAFKMQTMYRDFFFCGIHIHPDYVDGSVREIKYYHNKNVNIIGELCGYRMGFNTLISKGMFNLLEEAQSLKFAVCFHSAPSIEMEELGKAFPNLKMVFAHPGYKDDYLQRLQVVKKYDNISLDLSGTGIAYDGMLEYGISAIGSEKLIFGTDCPIYNPSSYIAIVNSAKITAREKDNIMFKNAEHIYGI